jgi:hypothetical protein
VLVQQIGRDHLDPVEQVLDPFITVMAGAAHDAYDLIPLGEQELSQIGAILPGDASDERSRQEVPPREVVSWACPH